METMQAHLAIHGHLYKYYLQQAGKAAIGIVMVGITLCCFFLARFLLGIYRLPRDSREYLYKREHVEGQALLRYAITVLCILIIDSLLLTFFDEGPAIMIVGVAIWTVILILRQVLSMLKSTKKKEVKAQ